VGSGAAAAAGHKSPSGRKMGAKMNIMIEKFLFSAVNSCKLLSQIQQNSVSLIYLPL